MCKCIIIQQDHTLQHKLSNEEVNVTTQVKKTYVS